jgi:hypothetical protein
MAEAYWQLLIDGNSERLLSMFSGPPRIDAVHPGTVTGADDVLAFAEGTHKWLEGMKAHLSPVRTTRGDCRTVAEQELHLRLDDGRDVHLPTAVVAERVDDPAGAERITVYHSMWPLNGKHDVRKPVLEVDPELAAPDVIGKYEEALAQGYLQGVMELFDPDGYVREPSGAPYVYRGDQQIREFYLTIFGNMGGIELDLCAITDDGEACAVEYNAVKWGRDGIPAQAGVAVYERNIDGDRLYAVRIYDDVTPPLAADTAASHGEQHATR